MFWKRKINGPSTFLVMPYLRGVVSLVVAITITLCIALCTSCGSMATTSFSNKLLNPTGQPILLDDITLITQDSSLTDEEKRAQLRILGILDEKLIDALLTL